jgi:hypothetical protein
LIFYFLLFLLCPLTRLPFQFSSLSGCPYEWVLVITPDRHYPKLLSFCIFFSWFSIFSFLLFWHLTPPPFSVFKFHFSFYLCLGMSSLIKVMQEASWSE